MKRVKQLAYLLALAVAPSLARADLLLSSQSDTAIAGQENFEQSDTSPTSSTLQIPLTDSGGGVMQFSGMSTASAEYGGLHGTSMASITNNITFLNGTGATGFSSSNSEFQDTLNFAGSIPAGYHAQYYFVVQGTLSHTGDQTGTDSGTEADIDFGVNDNYDVGKTYDIGGPVSGSNSVVVNDLWMPAVVDLDGALAQDIDVTLRTEAVVSTTQNVDGANFSYSAAFQDTLTLAGIDVVDDSGNSLNPSLWSVTSESGTQYPIGAPASPVPEPATLCVASLALLPLLGRRRSSNK